MRVLYIYSGIRKGRFNGQIGIDYPDTQFYGLNHLAKFGIEAEYKEPSVFLRKILGFRLTHASMFFFSRNYDIVFGSSLLYFLFWRKIFRVKTKYILLNISLNRTISKNKNKKLKSAILMWLLKELDAVVCLSNSQKRYLEETIPFLKGKVFFVPLGVDTSYYKLTYDNRDNFILSVGRDNGRDYKTVIEAARLMPREKFHLVLSPRNLKGITDVPDNVEVFFDIPFNELSEKYKKAKIFLLITKADDYSDGADCSGQTVLLDALASGLPIIASRKEYLKDYVREGRDVYLVDFYDVYDIKKAINIMNSDNEKRLNMAKEARQTVQNRFSTERMAEGLSLIFKELMNEKS